MVCLGSAASVACLVGLVCMRAAESSHDAELCFQEKESEKNSRRAAGIVLAHTPDEPLLLEKPAGAAPANTAPAKDAGAMAAARYGSDGGEEPTPEEIAAEIAALKEQYIEEQYGVVLRNDKWVPTVNGGSNLVYITTGSLPPGRVGEPYSVQFQATSGSPPYLWSILGSELPRQCSLDMYSGMLGGIPVEADATQFFLEVTDSRGARDIAEYVLVFQPEHTLGIATERLPAAMPGEDYFFQLQATGGVPPYVWSMPWNNAQHAALLLDPHTGQLHGRVDTNSPQSDIPLIFCVCDAQMQVSKEITLHVRTRLGILDAPASSVREGEEFEISFQATGGTEPYLWGLGSPLPPGLEFSATGSCSGNPSEPGLYEIALWVQDQAGQVDTAQFAIEVLPLLTELSGFEALLSRNSVALKWDMPTASSDVSVRIVRESTGSSTPSAATTVYSGSETSCLDSDVGAGIHYYTAILERNGTALTSAAPLVICATLPPETEPFADRLINKNLLNPKAFRSEDLPYVVLGAPRGRGLLWGSTDVASLGAGTCDDGGASAPYGGSITLEFADNEVWDGPGADLTISENVFYVCSVDGIPDPETRFMEPAVVSVSQDGVNWRQFKTDFSPRYDPDSGELNLRHPFCYNSGFAGVNPGMSDGYSPDPTDPAISGGDSFDISAVGFEWIRYVRIQSTGSKWLYDDDGDLIYHNAEMEAASISNPKSGFDLDAVTAIWMKKVESR